MKYKILTEIDRKDVAQMADEMRDADRLECCMMVGPGYTLQRALEMSVDCSFITRCVYDQYGQLLTMFGLSSVNGVLDDAGNPWMVSTPAIRKYARDLMKTTPEVLEEFLSIHPVLVNFVHENNMLSKRWLRRVGFELFEPVPYGPYNAPFHPFEMRAA